MARYPYGGSFGGGNVYGGRNAYGGGNAYSGPNPYDGGRQYGNPYQSPVFEPPKLNGHGFGQGAFYGGPGASATMLGGEDQGYSNNTGVPLRPPNTPLPPEYFRTGPPNSSSYGMGGLPQTPVAAAPPPYMAPPPQYFEPPPQVYGPPLVAPPTMETPVMPTAPNITGPDIQQLIQEAMANFQQQQAEAEAARQANYAQQQAAMLAEQQRLSAQQQAQLEQDKAAQRDVIGKWDNQWVADRDKYWQDFFNYVDKVRNQAQPDFNKVPVFQILRGEQPAADFQQRADAATSAMKGPEPIKAPGAPKAPTPPPIINHTGVPQESWDRYQQLMAQYAEDLRRYEMGAGPPPKIDVNLPQGHQVNLRTWNSLLPSEQALVGSAIQNKGQYIQDYMEAIRRAAPIGRNVGAPRWA